MGQQSDRPQVSTPTIGELLTEEEERLFVGRGEELQLFRTWLEGAGPRALLNITGPGGIGKTALLAAYKRAADAEARPTVAVDLSMMDSMSGTLLGRLGGTNADEIAARWKREGTVALLDGVEPGTPAARFLRELLGSLTPEIPVVAAGRYPMASGHARHERWPFEVRTIELRGLVPADAERYLAGRGVEEASLQKQILDAVGGFPLALSLAADLVTRFGVRHFPAAPEWRMAVQSLVQTLLTGVDDPELKELLEVCAVVRQFDEDLLRSVSGAAATGGAFDRLAALTVVRPTPYGLAFHDDVRRLLNEDLKWRRPERFREIRNRAQEHYRERARTATPEEREWLLSERMYLWENAFIQSLVFPDAEFAEVSIDVPTEAEIADVTEVERRFHVELVRHEYQIEYSVEAHMAHMDALIRAPGARVRVVRDRRGRVQGFNLIVRVGKDSFGTLATNPVLGTLMDVYFTEQRRESLPARAEDSDIYYLVQAPALPEAPAAATGLLLRDAIFSMIARSGLTLATAKRAEHQALLDALGFQQVPGVVNTAWGDDPPFRGYVLDLRVTGVEPWIRAVMEGRRAPALSQAELDVAIGDALVRFHDDDALSRSPLADIVGVPGSPETVRRLRASLEEAVRIGMERAGPDGRRALQAAEVGYIRSLGSHERAAESINVSRTTFFRLLKRGIELVGRSWAEIAREG